MKREKENLFNRARSVETYGKMPPNALDLEQVVLGAMLIEADSIRTAMSLIPMSEVFYSEKHQKVFEAMQNLWQEYQPIDILTVKQELKKMGMLELVGGAVYITELTMRINSAANIETHIRIIFEKWIRRLLIMIAQSYLKMAYDDVNDTFEILAKARLHLNKIEDALQMKKPATSKNLYKQTLEKIATSMNANGLTGIPSGFNEVDKLTGGWQKGDLIILAGRPSMGKTTLALNFLRNAALNFDKPGLFFSIEVSSISIMTKLISAESEISTSQMVKGFISDAELNCIMNKSSKLYSEKLFIDDAALTLSQIRAKAVIMKQKNNIEFIIIDYLQLMSSEKHIGSREQEISTYSRGLKLLAKELNIPIIALSQLSRSVETRGGDKRPQLSDLRESGAIEQDADVVAFVYRPEYYGITEYENGNSTHGIAEIIFAKHRNGGLKTIHVAANLKYSKFFDLPTHSEILNNSSEDEGTPF